MSDLVKVGKVKMPLEKYDEIVTKFAEIIVKGFEANVFEN